MMDKEKEIEDYKKILEIERQQSGKFKCLDKIDEETIRLNREKAKIQEFRLWDWTELGLYLRYDFWKADDGIAVLAGCRYPYDGDTMRDYDEPNDRDCPSHGEMCAHRYAQLSGVWQQSKLDAKHVRNPIGMAHMGVFDLEFPPSYFIEWAISKKLRIDWLDWAIERGLYTPKHEAAQPVQTATAPDYSTSWLTIQQAAINQFFNPRRNPDAKKEEIVEWIKAAAVNAGLPDSQNVPSTIFTIIKPENHDPKKKRVEPK